MFCSFLVLMGSVVRVILIELVDVEEFDGIDSGCFMSCVCRGECEWM